MKAGDWLLGIHTGRIGKLLKIHKKPERTYVVRHLYGDRWVITKFNKEIEERVTVVTKEVADILIAVNTTKEK